MTDSGAMPLRFGTLGIVIGYCGFKPFHNYTGQKDLFGQPLMAGKSNLAGGLAAAAVAVMGEGTEQTPLAILSDLSFVEFVHNEPGTGELADYFLAPDQERMFAPFFNHLPWQEDRQKNGTDAAN